MSTPFSAPAGLGGSQQHSNTALYGGAALAGAAAGAYMSAQAHGESSHYQYHTPATNAGAGFTNGFPPSQSTHTQQIHRHGHRGPLGKFVDWFRDPDAVAQYEQYTEAIGVCKYCFDPTSSPADAPRRHHFVRRKSLTIGRHGRIDRVDKTYRYSSDEDRKKGSAAKKVLIGGLTGYGVAKVGDAILKSNHDFDDTYSVKSGRPVNQNRVSFQDEDVRFQRRPRQQPPLEDVRLQRRDSGRTTSKAKGSFGTHGSRRRDSSSSSSSRGVSRGSASAAAGAVGLALGATAAEKTYRSRKGDKSRSSASRKDYYSKRVSPRHSYVDLTTSNSRQEGLLGFFSSPSANEKKGKRPKGFFTFRNGSSSSSDADLAFGEATVRRQSFEEHGEGRRGKRVGRDSTAAMMGLLATGEALAHESDQKQGKGKGRYDANEYTGRGRRRPSPPRNSAIDHGNADGGRDDDWADTDDDESLSSSSVDMALAYGGDSSALQSREDLVPGRKSSRPNSQSKSYGRLGRKDESSQRYDDNWRLPEGRTSAAFKPAAAAVSGWAASEFSSAEKTPSKRYHDPPPLQALEPRPLSDPKPYDVTDDFREKKNSRAFTNPQSTRVTMADTPLEQPQPIVPVTSFIYDNSFDTPRQERGTSISSPKTDYSQTAKTGRKPGRRPAQRDTESARTRRDSSPANLPSQDARDSVGGGEAAKPRGTRDKTDWRNATESAMLTMAAASSRSAEEGDESQRSPDTRRSSLDSSDDRVSKIERDLESLYAELRQMEHRDSKVRRDNSNDVAESMIATAPATADKEKQRSSNEEASPPRRKSSLKKTSDSGQASRAESQQERIARMAAQRVKSTPSPSHEDYKTFFVPKELQDHLKEHNESAEHRDDIGATVVEIVPGAAKTKTNHPFDPYTYRQFGLELEDDPGLHPWPVPLLDLIEPTPPGSQTHSVRGDASPIITPKSAEDSGEIGEPLERKSSTGTKVTWGDHDTYVYEVQTPEYERAEEYLPHSGIRKDSTSEAPSIDTDTPKEAPESSEGQSRPSVSRAWTLDDGEAVELEKSVPVVDDMAQMSRPWTVDDAGAEQIEHELSTSKPNADEDRVETDPYVIELTPRAPEHPTSSAIPYDHDTSSYDQAGSEHARNQAVYESPFADSVNDSGVVEDNDNRVRTSETNLQEANGHERENVTEQREQNEAAVLDGGPSSASPAIRVSKSEKRRQKRASPSSEEMRSSSRKGLEGKERDFGNASPMPGNHSTVADMADENGEDSDLPAHPRRSTTFDESITQQPETSSKSEYHSDPEEWERPKDNKKSKKKKRASKSAVSSNSKASSRSKQQLEEMESADSRADPVHRVQQELPKKASGDTASIVSDPDRKSRRSSSPSSQSIDQLTNVRDHSVDDRFVSADEQAETPVEQTQDGESFLASRPEMPPPTVTDIPMGTDGVSGPTSAGEPSAQPSTTEDTAPDVGLLAHEGEDRINFSQGFQDRGIDEDLDNAQQTLPKTPQYASSRRLSIIRTSDVPSSPTGITSSPTAVPLHFRRPPLSPTNPRFSIGAGSSPAPSSPMSPLTTPRSRQDRPKSTEFRSGKEMRPLYIVERRNFAKIATPQATEEYPSLPSSKTSSAHPSREDLRAEAQALEQHEIFTPSKINADMFRERGRRHSFSYWHDEKRRISPDYLDSRSATPVPGDAQKARENEKRGKPKYEFHSPSELLQDPSSLQEDATFEDGARPVSPLPSVVSTDLDQEYMSARSRSWSPTRSRSLSRGRRSASRSRSNSVAWQHALTMTAAGVLGSALAAHEIRKSTSDEAQAAPIESPTNRQLGAVDIASSVEQAGNVDDTPFDVLQPDRALAQGPSDESAVGQAQTPVDDSFESPNGDAHLTQVGSNPFEQALEAAVQARGLHEGSTLEDAYQTFQPEFDDTQDRGGTALTRIEEASERPTPSVEPQPDPTEDDTEISRKRSKKAKRREKKGSKMSSAFDDALVEDFVPEQSTPKEVLQAQEKEAQLARETSADVDTSRVVIEDDKEPPNPFGNDFEIREGEPEELSTVAANDKDLSKADSMLAESQPPVEFSGKDSSLPQSKNEDDDWFAAPKKSKKDKKDKKNKKRQSLKWEDDEPGVDNGVDPPKSEPDQTIDVPEPAGIVPESSALPVEPSVIGSAAASSLEPSGLSKDQPDLSLHNTSLQAPEERLVTATKKGKKKSKTKRTFIWTDKDADSPSGEQQPTATADATQDFSRSQSEALEKIGGDNDAVTREEIFEEPLPLEMGATQPITERRGEASTDIYLSEGVEASTRDTSTEVTTGDGFVNQGIPGSLLPIAEPMEDSLRPEARTTDVGEANQEVEYGKAAEFNSVVEDATISTPEPAIVSHASPMQDSEGITTIGEEIRPSISDQIGLETSTQDSADPTSIESQLPEEPIKRTKSGKIRKGKRRSILVDALEEGMEDASGVQDTTREQSALPQSVVEEHTESSAAEKQPTQEGGEESGIPMAISHTPEMDMALGTETRGLTTIPALAGGLKSQSFSAREETGVNIDRFQAQGDDPALRLSEGFTPAPGSSSVDPVTNEYASPQTSAATTPPDEILAEGRSVIMPGSFDDAGDGDWGFPTKREKKQKKDKKKKSKMTLNLDSFESPPPTAGSRALKDDGDIENDQANVLKDTVDSATTKDLDTSTIEDVGTISNEDVDHKNNSSVPEVVSQRPEETTDISSIPRDIQRSLEQELDSEPPYTDNVGGTGVIQALAAPLEMEKALDDETVRSPEGDPAIHPSIPADIDVSGQGKADEDEWGFTQKKSKKDKKKKRKGAVDESVFDSPAALSPVGEPSDKQEVPLDPPQETDVDKPSLESNEVSFDSTPMPAAPAIEEDLETIQKQKKEKKKKKRQSSAFADSFVEEEPSTISSPRNPELNMENADAAGYQDKEEIAAEDDWSLPAKSKKDKEKKRKADLDASDPSELERTSTDPIAHAETAASPDSIPSHDMLEDDLPSTKEKDEPGAASASASPSPSQAAPTHDAPIFSNSTREAEILMNTIPVLEPAMTSRDQSSLTPTFGNDIHMTTDTRNLDERQEQQATLDNLTGGLEQTEPLQRDVDLRETADNAHDPAVSQPTEGLEQPESAMLQDRQLVSTEADEQEWGFTRKKNKKDKKKRQSTLDEPETSSEPQQAALTKAETDVVDLDAETIPAQLHRDMADQPSFTTPLVETGGEEDWGFAAKKSKKDKKKNKRSLLLQDEAKERSTDIATGMEPPLVEAVQDAAALEVVDSRAQADSFVEKGVGENRWIVESERPSERYEEDKRPEKEHVLGGMPVGREMEETATTIPTEVMMTVHQERDLLPGDIRPPNAEASGSDILLHGALGVDAQQRGHVGSAPIPPEHRVMDVPDQPTEHTETVASHIADPDDIHGERGFISDGEVTTRQGGVPKNRDTKKAKTRKERRNFEFNGTETMAALAHSLDPVGTPEAETTRTTPEDIEEGSDVSASTRERRRRRRSPPMWTGDEPADLPLNRALTPPSDHDDIMDTALGVAAGLRFGAGEHEPTREEHRKPASLARQASASWSFAQFGPAAELSHSDANRDSGVQFESPLLSTSPLPSIRDSAFVPDAVERHSSYHGPRDLNAHPDVSLRPPRPESPTSSTEDIPRIRPSRPHEDDRARLETPRRKPSPVESTTKNRSSVLFNSSPAMPTPLNTQFEARSPEAVTTPLRRSPSIHGHHHSREELRQMARAARGPEHSDHLASNLHDRAAADAEHDRLVSPRNSLNPIREDGVEAHSPATQRHPFADPPVSLGHPSRPGKSRNDGADLGTAAGASILGAGALAMAARDLEPAKALGRSKARTSSLRNPRNSSTSTSPLDPAGIALGSSQALVNVTDEDSGRSATRDGDMADIYVSSLRTDSALTRVPPC